MKAIIVDSPWGIGKDTVAYRLDTAECLVEVISLEQDKADLGHADPQWLIDNKLIEYGVRPTVFPAVVVIYADDEHCAIQATYITPEMFASDK